MIIATERLVLREMDAARDAEFIFRLLNTPKFLEYIGDRGVRSVDAAAEFIENNYRQSYRDHGFGLYIVESKAEGIQLGVCGFVRRSSLPAPDLGFAFLPEYEGCGYGMESAAAMLSYGSERLGFVRVFAITSLDNHVSGRLLTKLGFEDAGIRQVGNERLRLYVRPLTSSDTSNRAKNSD